MPATKVGLGKAKGNKIMKKVAKMGFHESVVPQVFDVCGGINNDVHGLDADKDGIACESLP